MSFARLNPPEEFTGTIRVPPHNDAAERSVLGCCLISFDAWALVSTKLKATDFYRESHRHIFKAIHGLSIARVAPDVITLSDELNRLGLLDAVGGPNTILHLTNEIPSAANVQHYVEIVASKAKLRALAQAALVAADAVYEGEQTPEQIAARLGELVMGAAGGKERATTANSARASEEFWAMLEDELSGGGGGTSTGIAQLDDALGGGLKPGRVYMIGALSKMGKTVFASHLAARLFWVEEWAVDYVSVEQNAGDMAGKFLAWRTGIDKRALAQEVRAIMKETEAHAARHDLPRDPESLALLMRELHPLKVDAIRKMRGTLKGAADEMKKSNRLWITTEGEPNAHEMALMCRARQLDLRMRGLDPQKYLPVFDYLQSFGVGGNVQDERVRIANASRILSGIAHDLNIPVLVLFQMKKEADDAFVKYKKMPRFNDARGTGQIANDCNHMLIVHRALRDDANLAYQDHGLIRHELSRDGGDGVEVEVHMDRIRSHVTSWPDASLRDLIYGEQKNAASKGEGGSWRE